MGIRWVDEVPVVEIEADGVRVTVMSGDEAIVFRLTRHVALKTAELGIALFAEAERLQRESVAGIHGVCPYPSEDRCDRH